MSHHYVVQGRRDEGAAAWRNGGTWGTGLLLFAALAALFLSLQIFQASAEGPAKRTHERAIAALTEIDTLLARNYGDLRERAEASQPGETLLLRDYPVEVPLTREEVLAGDEAAFRELLLTRSADVMYADGTSALRDSEGADSVGRFTAAGVVDRSLDLLRKDVHDLTRVTTFVLGAICIFLAVTLATVTRGFGRLGSVGIVLLLASLPLALGGLAVRLTMRTGTDGDGEYVGGELLDIGATMALIPIRNGLAFATLGGAFVLIALVLGRVAPGRGASYGEAPASLDGRGAG